MKRKLLAFTVFLILAFIVGSLLLRQYQNEKWGAANDAMLYSGDYSEAVKCYTDLIWWDDTNPSLYYLRAGAYNALGVYDSAISDYNRAIRFGSRDTLQINLRVGIAEMSKGDLDRAHQEFSTLSLKAKGKADNEYWSANYHLGQLEYLKGNYQEALKYYDVARGIKVAMNETYHRANAYYALGMKDSAVDCYNRSIQFVKRRYTSFHPNSIISKCDTCGFAFGTLDYILLTRRDLSVPKMIDLLESAKTINRDTLKDISF